MTLRLVPGQNAPLRARRVRFVANSDAPLDVSGLAVGPNLESLSADGFVFYNKPQTSGVALQSDGLQIELAAVEANAAGVLCIVSVDPATSRAGTFGRLSAALVDENNAAVAEFDVPLSNGISAVLCFELYRKGEEWKVRAIGQGYAGGLAQLITTHGVEVDDQPEPAATQPAQRKSATSAIPIEPLDRNHAFERMWMIFEDAARSAASLQSSRDYADKRLDDELSAAVAAPKTRNSPAGNALRATAQRRYDELVAKATAGHDNDSDHLIRELATIDPALPRSLASWNSAAWLTHTPDPSDGIRLGEVSANERGDLRIPFCVRLPLTRPLWIDTESPSAASPVVSSIVLRLLSASSPTPSFDAVDLTGSLDSITGPLRRLMTGPVIRNHAEISARLEIITNEVELEEMAAADRGSPPEGAGPVIVLSDFPHGYQATDIEHIIRLAAIGPAVRLSLIIVGSNESQSTDSGLSALSRHCQHLPTIGDLKIFDPWTDNEWEFTPDAVPNDSDRLAKVMGVLARR
jgi:stress response protein SCP2